MTDNEQDGASLSKRLRETVLTPDSKAHEMVLVELDTDVVDRLKDKFGAEWKTAAAEILKKAQL
jgi:uncharacterized protein (DUF4415 family)